MADTTSTACSDLYRPVERDPEKKRQLPSETEKTTEDRELTLLNWLGTPASHHPLES